MSGPEAGRDMTLLFPDRVRVDRRRRELRMAQPALHEVKRNALFNTSDAKAMPQPFGTRLGARDPGPCHDLDDAGVGRFQAPPPEMRPGGAVAEAMHQIKGIEEGGWDRHRTVE